MSTPSKAPTYNLKVVIRETGLKPDTLRAWERRYGLPEPERTPGGHRLYSEYDIATIKWLVQRQKEGMRINRAVALWRDIESKGEEPLDAFPQPNAATGPRISDIETGETIKEMRKIWISACLDFDEPTGEYILAQAFSRYPLQTVCLDILQQGLHEIGELWYRGEATVQQEHFTSALTIRRLNAILAAAPAPTRTGKFLVACPPEEDHIFSSLLITLLLRHSGWNVVYLGANVPVAQLEETVKSTNPSLVIMTATQLHTAATLYEVAKYLHSSGTALAYGGRIFNQHPRLRETIPGYFLGEELANVIPAIEELTSSQPGISPPEPVADEYQQALAHFRDRQAQIDLQTWDKTRTNGIKKYHLEIANDFLRRDITSALSLGAMDYLQEEFDWIKMLLQHHSIPIDLFPKYLHIYREALDTCLDERGKPIIDWLSEMGTRAN